ncbi:MAG: 23S rRNA (adenine(2503)-C(2))-methyltransferase RlmN [Chloroflexi bacterium]|nr:MAG: 23S rRNA (adenine(2503)-C(2))-methyltransferase RlmN [Chloroflexota bacterium]
MGPGDRCDGEARRIPHPPARPRSPGARRGAARPRHREGPHAPGVRPGAWRRADGRGRDDAARAPEEAGRRRGREAAPREGRRGLRKVRLHVTGVRLQAARCLTYCPWSDRTASYPVHLRQGARNLADGVRSGLEADFRISSLRPLAVSQADRSLTTKTLYELDGGHSVEAVVMRYADRSTLCISSQAGCPIGCPFCATGKFPFGRNLKAHEIVEQALDAVRMLAAEGRRLSHVVFMGMGEPMANYQSVIESVRRMSDADLLGISPRRIVVSTSGLIPRIAQLGEEKLPVTLAISLHAARDELRDVLVPINRKYPVAELVASSQAYAGKTGRRVSYEWVLLAGVNDTERDAKELGTLLRGKLAHVNLIPFNPVDGTPYRAPERAAVRRFREMVEAQSLNVTVRDTRGRDADAACGQLHERVMRERAAPVPTS